MKTEIQNTENLTDARPDVGSSNLLAPVVYKRKPLKRGNVYQFKKSSVKIKIKYVVFSGHPEDDGGMEGVAVDWIRCGRIEKGMFYPCKSDAEFFAKIIFANACDPIKANEIGQPSAGKNQTN